MTTPAELFREVFGGPVLCWYDRRQYKRNMQLMAIYWALQRGQAVMVCLANGTYQRVF